MPNMMRVRTTLNYGQGGPGLSTAYFFGAGGSPVTADATDVVGRVRAFWAALVGMLDNGMAAAPSGNVDLIDSATGALTGGLTVAPPAIVTGTGGATPLPPANCLLIRLQTATIVAGRRLEGRVYVSRLSTVANLAGVPTTAAGVASTNAVTALLSGATTSSPLVWHRPIGAGSGSTGVVLGGAAAPFFGVLRSRRDS